MKEKLGRFFSYGAFYWVPACVVAYLWIFLAGTAADALARWNLDVFAPGMLVVVPALLMPFFRGLSVVLISGLLFDVSLPLSYEMADAAAAPGASTDYVSLFGEMATKPPSTTGVGVMLAAIFFLVLRIFRRRLAAGTPRQWLLCALAANFAIFLSWACAFGRGRLGELVFWAGFFANALASALFIVLLGWWYFDAVVSLYRICGNDLIEKREAAAES